MREHTINEKLRVIGQNIKRFRKAKGISQRDLAKACNISRNTICNIENLDSRIGMGVRQLLVISDALDVDIGKLFEITEDEGQKNVDRLPKVEKSS